MSKKIIAFGNPLMDTSCEIPLDKLNLFDKYNLKIDGQKEVTFEEINAINNDLLNLEKTKSSGGCAQNTLKIMKWLLGTKLSATICGSIGNDNDGKMLKTIMLENGIETEYFVDKSHKTGTTLALITTSNRSLVAHLGAAEILDLNTFKSNRNLFKTVRNADLVYIEGFFITKRAEIATCIAEICKTNKVLLAFNISGQYLSEVEPETLKMLSIECDILFGNYEEFQSLANLVINSQNVESFLEYLTEKLPHKIVVVTNNSQPILARQNYENFRFNVEQIDREDIVDTTGAGDAFVGGFLAAFLCGKQLSDCVHVGCYAAGQIIRVRGCNVPEIKPKVLTE